MCRSFWISSNFAIRSTLVDADILGAVIEKFVSSDINLSPNPVWKDGAVIVNVARGELVDLKAINENVTNGKLKG